MAKAPQTQSPPPRPRLYVVAPCVNDSASLAQKFEDILGAADVAVVLLRLPQGGERALIDYAKTIVPVVQGKGVALLLDGHPELVARAGADGAHLTGIEAFTEALDTLKPRWIAGAGGLRTRHDAMLAGERGADYLMFGEPAGPRPPFEATVERVAWWAELFELPCVGYAEGLDEVATLAAAGADFVALGEFVFSDWEAASDMIGAAAERAHVPAKGRTGPDPGSASVDRHPPSLELRQAGDRAGPGPQDEDGRACATQGSPGHGPIASQRDVSQAPRKR
jgi:thiamine-phosphate pyrophosphorylase